VRKSKFSETQIVGILKDAESGMPVPDLLEGRGQRSDVLQMVRQARRGFSLGREAAA
jgi:hypothetical protein